MSKLESLRHRSQCQRIYLISTNGASISRDSGRNDMRERNCSSNKGEESIHLGVNVALEMVLVRATG